MFSAAAPHFNECIPNVFLGQCQTHLEKPNQVEEAVGIPYEILLCFAFGKVPSCLFNDQSNCNLAKNIVNERYLAFLRGSNLLHHTPMHIPVISSVGMYSVGMYAVQDKIVDVLSDIVPPFK
jgi:hypothetical protein